MNATPVSQSSGGDTHSAPAFGPPLRDLHTRNCQEAA